MVPTVDPTVAGVGALVLFVAGATNGLAGFGFALVGTMALATLVPPATAVVFMIVPIFAVNLSLVSELSVAQLRTCSQRFGPLIAAALVGTVAGMVALTSIPTAPLRFALGVLTLGFVVTAQRRVAVPVPSGGHLAKSTPGMIGVGVVSGVVFGATNVGVQLIAYLRSFDLSHGLFVGVVALVFLGLNALRVGVAGALGLYPSAAVAGASVLAALPAVLGVVAGKYLRVTASEGVRRAIVLALLTLVGLRLVAGGVGLA